MTSVPVQSTVETPSPTEEPPRAARTTQGRVRLVIGWHLLATLAAAWVVFNVANPAGFSLGAAARTLTGVAGMVALLLNPLAAFLLLRTSRRGRTLSIALNYLTAVALLAAALQASGLFTALDEFAGAFQRTFLWLLVVAVGAGWVVVARRLQAKAPQPARVLEWAGWAVLGAGALAWLWVAGVPGGLLDIGRRFLEPAPLLFLVGGVLALLATRIMWSDDIARTFGVTRRQSETLAGWVYLSPNIIGFLVFFAGPLLFSLVISFYNWDPLGEKSFAGIDNYTALFSDDLFWRSMRNILVFMIVAVPLSVIPALFLAVLLTSKYPGMKGFRAVFFIPSVAGVIGISLIWKQLFNATVGFLNYSIAQVLNGVDLLTPGDTFPDRVEIEWTSNPDIALFAVILVFAWMQFGFNTVLYTAGLQGVPKELYEAAMLDGANPWQRFRNITIPILRPTTFFVVTTTTILALQLFDIAYALTIPNPLGAPNNATLTPVEYLYIAGFQRFDQGYASAVAWALFVVIFAVTLLQFRRQRRQTEGV